MGIFLKVIIFCSGLIFVATVAKLLVDRKINERNSLLWLLSAVVIMTLAISPNLLEVIANLAGVGYPPTMLFLFAILMILFIVLYQSIQLSILQDQLREITQQLTIAHSGSPMEREEDHGR